VIGDAVSYTQKAGVCHGFYSEKGKTLKEKG
jgi:hypothetical protein